MANLTKLSMELEYYFNNLAEDEKKLTVIREVPVNGIWEKEEFFTIVPTPIESHFLFCYRNEVAEEITNASLRTIHAPLLPLLVSIKKHNDISRKKKGELPPPDSVDPLPADEEIYAYKKLAKTGWQRLISPLTFTNDALKWIARKLFLDTFLSKYTVGVIIAFIANKGNSHYKTEAHTITETLGPLIFPAGFKRPKVSDEGKIYLDPILSAQYESLKNYNRDYISGDKTIHFTSFKIQIDKKTLLDSATASNDLANSQPEGSTHLHIIYFNGNSGCYQGDEHMIAEDLLAFERDYDLPVTTVQFNYPGVLNSTGKAEKAFDLVEAGIAQVERLHKEKNIPYEKIGLHGWSLGGSIVSHVASYYHKRGISLAGTYAAKTFSSTTSVALSYVEKIPYIGNILAVLLRFIVACGEWGSRWKLDTASNFISLPENEREYSLVRTMKAIRNIYEPIDDSVIPHEAALHKSWRLRLMRFFNKQGLFGYDKSTYKETNEEHKMVVIQKNPAGDLVYQPKTCGHSTTNSNHDQDGIFLYHRTKNESDVIALLPAGDADVGEAKPINLCIESGVRMRGFFAHPENRLNGAEPSTAIVRAAISAFN